MTSAITNPLKSELKKALMAADMLMGNDEDCMRWLRYQRKLAKEAAKTVAKTVVKEIGSAATDEAKDLGQAATRKVMELGERRRRRRAEKHPATDAAKRQAEQLGIEIEEIEGSGADGRVTVQDVKRAAKGE